ncbi:MAG: GNAT family N-acetyltransferase [Parashewanella sp.]
MIQIQSDQLTLRSAVEKDWPNFLKVQSDPEVNRYIRIPQTEAVIRQKFEVSNINWTYGSGNFLSLIIENTQQEFIGVMGFRCLDPELNNVEVGYVINPVAQGNGYGTQALQLMLPWAISTFNIHKFVAYCASGNIGSQKVLENSGFQREGLLRENIKIGEQWIDDFVYGLIVSEVL